MAYGRRSVHEIAYTGSALDSLPRRPLCWCKFVYLREGIEPSCVTATGHRFNATSRSTHDQMLGSLADTEHGRLLAHAFVTSVVSGAVAADGTVEGILQKIVPALAMAVAKDCVVAKDALVTALSGGIIDEAIAHQLGKSLAKRSPNLSLADMGVAVALVENVCISAQLTCGSFSLALTLILLTNALI